MKPTVEQVAQRIGASAKETSGDEKLLSEMSFAERRIANGYLAKQLVVFINTTPTMLSRYENGIQMPSPDRLEAIAHYYGLTTNEWVKLWKCTRAARVAAGKKVSVKSGK